MGECTTVGPSIARKSAKSSLLGVSRTHGSPTYRRDAPGGHLRRGPAESSRGHIPTDAVPIGESALTGQIWAPLCGAP
eukprot:12401252-Karenia_brevis.AAC.1